VERAAPAPDNNNNDGMIVRDKWGLPPPTLEDIFPPLPDDGTTELIAIEDNDTEYSKAEMQEDLKSVTPLDLSRFDEKGVEVEPSSAGNENDSSSGGRRNKMRLRLLHRSPPILLIENFLTSDECEAIKSVAMPAPGQKEHESLHAAPIKVESKTFAGAISKRTSTSWFCHYRTVPVLLAKMVHMLGLSVQTMEEPQIVHYRAGQEFSWHYDQVPQSNLENGGQRLGTFLVYLQSGGGGTVFRDLKHSLRTGQALSVRPVRGNALLFFPASGNGAPDERTLHRGEASDAEEKCICQVWVHERRYRAVVPPGNCQEDAAVEIENASRELGYL
jgi:prolyl 4-hydroxylase